MSYLKDLDYSVVQQCMHCGMCLPTCPTYVETKMERNSPRGRISLMRAIADGQLEAKKAFSDEMYFCLGCLACETACPAGVDYTQLFEMARAEAERSVGRQSVPRRLFRWVLLDVLFCQQWRLRFVGKLLWIYQATGLQSLVRRSGVLRLLPKSLRALEAKTPTIQRHFSPDLIAPLEVAAAVLSDGAASAGSRRALGGSDSVLTLPRGSRRSPSDGAFSSGGPAMSGVRVLSGCARGTGSDQSRYRVGLLTGCVQDLIYSHINRDTADVLLANDCTVVTPPSQACCGSLHAHNGEYELAKDYARRLLDQFDLDQLDAVITNAAGCGSHLKHFDRLLHDDPHYAAKAQQWSEKVKDISEWLVEIGIHPPEKSEVAVAGPRDGAASDGSRRPPGDGAFLPPVAVAGPRDGAASDGSRRPPGDGAFLPPVAVAGPRDGAASDGSRRPPGDGAFLPPVAVAGPRDGAASDGSRRPPGDGAFLPPVAVAGPRDGAASDGSRRPPGDGAFLPPVAVAGPRDGSASDGSRRPPGDGAFLPPVAVAGPRDGAASDGSRRPPGDGAFLPPVAVAGPRDGAASDGSRRPPGDGAFLPPVAVAGPRDGSASDGSRRPPGDGAFLPPVAVAGPRDGAASVPTKTRVTYHDACHLCHGQKITAQPRELLAAIPGLEIAPLTESMWCCGSAGIYNLIQPEMADKLLQRKLDHITATGATVVATGNPGCLLQIQNGLAARGMKIEVVHPVTLLARAYRTD